MGVRRIWVTRCCCVLITTGSSIEASGGCASTLAMGCRSSSLHLCGNTAARTQPVPPAGLTAEPALFPYVVHIGRSDGVRLRPATSTQDTLWGLSV